MVALVFCAVTARLFWLQIIEYRSYEERAARQQKAPTVRGIARGEIFMHKQGELVPGAITQEGWLLAINPSKISDPEALYGALSAIQSLTLSKEEFIRRASKKDDPHEVIEHRVTTTIRREIESASTTTGVEFLQERWRAYPAGDFASHVIGFVGGDDTGQYGIEQQYNRDLSGEETGYGATIVLTLDAGVQARVEKAILEVQKLYHARSAGALIMRPRTGAIIAMAATPSYDPNAYRKVENISVFTNPLVESLFEMGSVVKPLTMAAAIDAGVVTLESTYVDPGTRTIDNATIGNFDGKARGKIPIQEILSQSLNMGAVFLMESLGKDRFRTYMRSFGLGDKTRIDLPNEATGKLSNLESPRLLEYATASFGQGISMSAIELVRALASIANGGFLVDPYLVEEKQSPRKERVLKEETAKTVTRMLVEVVDKKLANGKGKIPGYAVAAKTGTAQIARTDGRGYSDDFMHTFFGYGPAFDPEFLIFIYLERPQGIRYASESLTGSFRSLMQFLFSYFEIVPDRPQELAPAQS